MNRRILAFLLSLAMIAGMLPVTVLAQEEERVPNIIAAFSDNLSMDGSLNETAWITDGKLSDGENTGAFGVLWDSAALYIAVKPQSGDSVLGVETAGKRLTVDLATLSCSGELAEVAAVVKNTAVEIRIPFAALGLEITCYDQKLPVLLTLDALRWDGTVQFVSDDRSTVPAFGSMSVVSPTGSANLTNEASNGSYQRSR